MNQNIVSNMPCRQEGFVKPIFKSNDRIKINNPEYSRPVVLFFSITALLSLLSLVSLNIEWARIASRTSDFLGVLGKLSLLSFNNFDMVMIAFLETVTVTILATLYSLTAGLLFGSLMARNITPNRKIAAVLSAFFSFVRAVPTPVWVLLVLVCLGFGPGPGIVGLSFHAVAFFARTFAQSFEEVSVEVIEALKSVGANRLQIFFSAVFPASLTSLIAWSALRFETNFSEAAILGMVGAGGIGYSIQASMSSYEYGRAGLAILLVFLFAYSLEILFTNLKRKMKV